MASLNVSLKITLGSFFRMVQKSYDDLNFSMQPPNSDIIFEFFGKFHYEIPSGQII